VGTAAEPKVPSGPALRRSPGRQDFVARARRAKIAEVAQPKDGTGGLPPGVDIFSAAPDGIVVVDDAGQIAAVNELVADMFGYGTDELIGRPIETLLPERYHDRHVENRKAFTEQPTRRPMGLALPLYGLRKTGEEFPVDVSLNHQRAADGTLRVVAFVRDITARRRMEEGLRTAEESFKLLVEGVGDHAILMLDPGGRVMTWNTGAQRIKGWSADDIIGRHFSIFYVAEDVASGQPERDLERAAAEGRAQSEGWRKRANGRRFWAETTLSAMRGPDGTLRGFAKVTRDRTEHHQVRARLESVGELNQAALENRPEVELLALTVGRVRAMTGATLVGAWAPRPGGEGFDVVSAQGDGAGALTGTNADGDSIVTAVARSEHPEMIRDLRADLRVPRVLVDAGLASALFLPLHAGGEVFAVLVIAQSPASDPLEPHDIDLLQAFGLQVSASLAFARARRELEQLQIVSERERIARDLHDPVIQRLFAVGLSLEATGRRPPHEIQERLQQAVADIDDTIRSIRTSIFTLQTRAEETKGLRAQVLEVVSDLVPALGFEPSVQFEGPVDTVATAELTGNVVAVLREALTNTARHAHATEVTVTIAAGDELVVNVTDDGKGSDAFERVGGRGVQNLVARARNAGGDARIGVVEPHGTRVEWRVPIPS
jgi:PAS domain S-box-containing protein